MKQAFQFLPIILFLCTSCIQIKNKPSPVKEFQTFTDPRDLEVYRIISINNKTWFADNLRYSKDIQVIESTQVWNETKQPAWSLYENNFTYNLTFGKLYNGYAVKSGKLCPPGWHIPTQEEWTDLINFLGGFEIAGIKMKALKSWKKFDPNDDQATNESGWSGLPGGYRESNGEFAGIEGNGFWWSSTGVGPNEDLWGWILYPTGTINRFPESPATGRSCRCIKD